MSSAPCGPQVTGRRGSERELALAYCLQLVAAVDEVRVYGGQSEGMRLELAEARRLGIPVVIVGDQNGDDPRVGTTRAVREGRARC